MLHQHPNLELELFHLERRHLERHLTLARQWNQDDEPLVAQFLRIMRQVVRVPGNLRLGWKAPAVVTRPALPTRPLIEGVE